MKTGIGTTLLAIFGLILLIIPPHVTGIVFLFLLSLYEYSKQAERKKHSVDEDSDTESMHYKSDGSRPDFGAMFNNPDHIKEQEDLR